MKSTKTNRRKIYLSGADLFTRKKRTEWGAIIVKGKKYRLVSGACHHFANQLNGNMDASDALLLMPEFKMFEPLEGGGAYFWTLNKEGDNERILALLFCAEMCK